MSLGDGISMGLLVTVLGLFAYLYGVVIKAKDVQIEALREKIPRAEELAAEVGIFESTTKAIRELHERQSEQERAYLVQQLHSLGVQTRVAADQLAGLLDEASALIIRTLETQRRALPLLAIYLDYLTQLPSPPAGGTLTETVKPGVERMVDSLKDMEAARDALDHVVPRLRRLGLPPDNSGL